MGGSMAGDVQKVRAGRTLGMPGQYVGQVFGRKIVLPPGNYVTAHRFNGEELVAVQLLYHSGFVSAATDWERLFSVLSDDPYAKVPFDPIVDADNAVVGHVGWVTGSNLLVPEPSGRTPLGELLLNGTPVFVRLVIGVPGVPEFIDGVRHVRPFTSEQRFQLVTDVEGRVLLLMRGDLVGLEAADGLFWGLMGVGSLVAALGRAAARQIIRSLVSRIAAYNLRRRLRRMTVDEMEQFLIAVMQRRSELGRLYGITVRNLTGEALNREIQAVLRGWEQQYGRSVRFVDEGVVQAMTRSPGNVMSLQSSELMIERQLLRDPREFFRQVTHELSADALGVRGRAITGLDLPFIGDYFTRTNNALFILESALSRIGSLRQILNMYL